MITIHLSGPNLKNGFQFQGQFVQQLAQIFYNLLILTTKSEKEKERERRLRAREKLGERERKR